MWLTIKYTPKNARTALLNKLKEQALVSHWLEKETTQLSLWIEDDKFSATLERLRHWQEIETFTFDGSASRQVKVPMAQWPKPAPSSGFDRLIGVSLAHNELIQKAKKLANLPQPLLIYGETGTGKEALARACHLFSERAEQPFMVLNCAAMPDDVLESELFGHAGCDEHKQRGIFELANGGTVFLDDLGQMSSYLQLKLIRVLQDGRFRRVGEESEVQVDVRIMAASRHSAQELLASQQIRDDLFYRLNVLTLTILPLRARRDDIAPLCRHMLLKHAEQLGIAPPRLSDDLIVMLNDYAWTGNVRELDNAILNALTDFSGDELCLANFSNLMGHMDKKVVTGAELAVGQGGALTDETLGDHLGQIVAEYEKQVLSQLYQRYPSSRKLAKRLNVSHTSIANKLRQYEIG